MDNNNSSGPEPLRPLSGITIVEYGTFHAGPGGTAILADLGATVIKIEEARFDPERSWTSVGGTDLSMPNGDSIFFEISNRNKKGVCIDIKKEQGRAIFHRLIETADVFMTNLRKSTKKKLGLDYDTLRPFNTKIIYAGVSGYGPDGEMSDQGAYDPMGMARSGMMYLTGSDEPVRLNLAILDQAAAICTSHAILTALFARERHGIGQEVHISLYGTALWVQYANLMISNSLAINPCFPDDRSKHSPLRNIFRCKDGAWIMGTHHPEEKYWANFCRLTGMENLLADSNFTDEKGAPKNFPDLNQIFDKLFLTKNSDQWMDILAKNGLLFCNIQRISDIKNDPQAIANEYIKEVDHPVLGTIQMPGYPVRFSTYQAGYRSPAPDLGEHTDSVLLDLGYANEEIADLKKKGVIQ